MKLFKLKKNNNGFTLIETIVSTLIMAIVALAISVLMSTGSRLYTAANFETKMQKEAQIAMNQINDIMMKAVSYEYVKDASFGACSGSALFIKTSREDSTTGENYYAVILDTSDHQLLFRKSSSADLEAEETNNTYDLWKVAVAEEEISSTTPSLLANYIDDIIVAPEVYTQGDDTEAQITVKLKLEGNEFSTFSSIDMRNR